jgi:hypothetical protein
MRRDAQSFQAVVKLIRPGFGWQPSCQPSSAGLRARPISMNHQDAIELAAVYCPP